MHTLDVGGPERDCLVIFASWGLGRTVVEGQGPADRYVVERDYPHRIRRRKSPAKKTWFGPWPAAARRKCRSLPEDQSRETLSEAIRTPWCRGALSLERYFKRPQEIEWALDQAGNCWVLQSRALHLPKRRRAPAAGHLRDLRPLPRAHPGHRGGGPCRGGRRRRGPGQPPMWTWTRFPEDAVLVTKYTAPWLARIVPKAAAIVAERGSAAGHLATIAREFRVPTLVGVEGATEILPAGMKVTVDTKQRSDLRRPGQRTAAVRAAPDPRL